MPPANDRNIGRSGQPVDLELERWRGQITEQVGAHDRQLLALNGDLRGIHQEFGAMRQEMATLKAEVTEARSDIGEAVDAFGKAREQEQEYREGERDKERESLQAALKEAVGEHVMTKRDIFRFVVAPVVVGVTIALIIYAATGGKLI